MKIDYSNNTPHVDKRCTAQTNRKYRKFPTIDNLELY